MPTEHNAPARNFFLNEQHELSRGEKSGGGRTPQFVDIDWASKGRQISDSLQAARSVIQSSNDPLRDHHYFVLAKPVTEVRKRSQDKKKARDGIISEVIDFAKDDSRVFGRLGLELLNVTDEGHALVHMRPERVDQLISTSAVLKDVSSREQARWAGIDLFDVIPPELRIDADWVQSLQPNVLADAVIEFQPLLSRSEIDTLLRAIGSLLRQRDREALTGIGSDFSGRHWVRGKLTPGSLYSVARMFYSVQTVHSPLISFASATSRARRAETRAQSRDVEYERRQDVTRLPTVALLDTGVPSDHSLLADFRRGSYIAASSFGSAVGDHGSFVASRIVFGDPDFGDDVPSTPPGTCRFYDMIVGLNARDIDDKSVISAMSAVVGTAPDVRVFNLSFDTSPIELLGSAKRRENLILVRDLDNFIFQNDIVVVVAAGNSPDGIQPSRQYPLHYDDPQWQLGAWARSFNSLTCGSYVGRLHPGGLVQDLGWPSPFTRVGPGLCDSPKPDYSANGGNTTATMQFSAGLGVWGLTRSSLWEDRSGSSYAAPLLAREAAFASDVLQRVCLPGASPYGVTIKAILALTAEPPQVGGVAKILSERSLGRGRASTSRLKRPEPSSAVMLWQGVLEGPEDIARIKIPIPSTTVL